MTIAARRHSHPSPQVKDCTRRARRRFARLRHIHPTTHAQQLALIEQARAAQRSKQECETARLREQMLGLLPILRAFALSLTNDPGRADDLVQDTILRAWTHLNHFRRGTNLEAWLFTILRNSLYSEHRKRKHEVEDPGETYAARLSVPPAQEAGLEMNELRLALACLPRRRREALLWIGVEGLTYEEVATAQGVAVGTIKSRVNRARSQLARLLHMEDRHEIGPDQVMKAALQSSTDLHL
jgi:RNA polymerase sigma-70 factor (ECF subfamily)